MVVVAARSPWGTDDQDVLPRVVALPPRAAHQLESLQGDRDHRSYRELPRHGGTYPGGERLRQLYLKVTKIMQGTWPYAPSRTLRMPKALCITGLSIAVVLFVLFLWDLVVPAWLAPFKGASLLMDIAFILSAAGLGYLSWTTWKEQG